MKRVIRYEQTDVNRDELITIMEAARILDISHVAVNQRVNAGTISSYIDTEAPSRQGRVLVMRVEVEEWKQRRKDLSIWSSSGNNFSWFTFPSWI